MDEKQYTKKEFRHMCVQMGYAPSKVVTEYYKQNPKDYYTDDDVIPCYRMACVFAGIRRTTKRKT